MDGRAMTGAGGRDDGTHPLDDTHGRQEQAEHDCHEAVDLEKEARNDQRRQPSLIPGQRGVKVTATHGPAEIK